VNARALLAIPIVCGLAGIAMLVVSNVMYVRRTRTSPFNGPFWLRRTVLTPREYLLNRLGFGLALAVLPLMLVAGLLIRSLSPK